MPPQNDSSNPQYTGVTCNATCATKIANYILGGFAASNEQPNLFLKQSAASSTPAYSLLNSSETSCGIAYSANNLRPLTRQEYSAAVFQLTGIDLIDTLGQGTYDALPSDSQVDITLNSDSQASYNLVANKIIDNLSSSNFAAIVDCANSSSEQCYNQLLDDFACKAFRRPLTSAERSDYLATYSVASNSTEGISKLANAILTSAKFVYRSNIGLALLNRELDASTTLTLTSAASLINEAKTLAIYQSTSLAANFSGSDLLEISVKSTQNANGLWPVMRVQVGESTFVDLIANQAEATYQFHIAGLKGSNSISITNQQAGAPLEYQAGHNLILSSVKLALSY